MTGWRLREADGRYAASAADGQPEKHIAGSVSGPALTDRRINVLFPGGMGEVQPGIAASEGAGDVTQHPCLLLPRWSIRFQQGQLDRTCRRMSRHSSGDHPFCL
jgi:hypothetical protein